MEYNYTLPIGDWSKDGHSRCEHVTVYANKAKETIQNAYIQFEQTAQLTFDVNRRHMSRLLDAYGNNYLTETAMQELTAAGVNLSPVRSMEDESRDDNRFLVFDEPRMVAVLFMECVKSQLPDLEYRLPAAADNYLFGYWDEKLNIQVGYGIFS